MDNLAVNFDVECSIHMGILEDGVKLSCGHEFCRLCLIFLRARNRGDLMCPTCRTKLKNSCSHLRQNPNSKNETDLLYTGALTFFVPSRRPSIDEANETLAEQAKAQLEHVDKSCTFMMERLQRMLAEVIGIKCSNNERLKLLNDRVKIPKGQQRSNGTVSSDLIYDYVIKSAKMLENDVFCEFNFCMPKFFNAVDLYREIAIPSFQFSPEFAEKSDEIFKFATSLFFGLPSGDFTLLANSFAKYLQSTCVAISSSQDFADSSTILDDVIQRIWIVTAGHYKCLYTLHSNFLRLEFGAVTLVACQCATESGCSVPVDQAEMSNFISAECKHRFDHLTPDRLCKALKCETGLDWHCSAGKGGRFSVQSGQPFDDYLCRVQCAGMEVVVWQG